MAITIGAPAVVGDTQFTQDWTWINQTGPANATGNIDTVQIYATVVDDLVGCYVGIFYTTNGDTLKCRSAVAIGAVVGGAVQTFPGLTLAVVIGDYIGLYYSDGAIRYRNTFGAGLWHSNAEVNHCIVDDEFIYTDLAGTYAISLYGTGTAGWSGKISGVTDPAKIMGVDVGDIQSVKGVTSA